MKSQVIFDTDIDGELELSAEFINNLLKYNLKSRAAYLDIHIYQEEALIIVEWSQVFYDSSDCCDRFEFIDSDHCVVKEVILPDNSIMYALSEADERQMREDWERENEAQDGGDI